MSRSIKNVLIIGATGSIGPSLITHLQADQPHLNLSVLTRTTSTSTSTLPSSITVHRTDYTYPSLLSAFTGIDAIVSLIATFSTSIQATIIDAAVASNIQLFIPSEFGVDTSLPQILEMLPPAAGKIDTIKHLQSKEKDGLAWSAIIVGAFLDWTFRIPGIQGWNLPARKALLFDGGETEYEVTTLAQTARAIGACLKPGNFEATKNRYVYVNSFTTTQKEILACLEKIMGEKWDVKTVGTGELVSKGWKGLGLNEEGWFGYERITAALYGWGHVNQYSKTKGLSNKKLGLPKEDMEEILREVVGTVGAKGWKGDEGLIEIVKSYG